MYLWSAHAKRKKEKKSTNLKVKKQLDRVSPYSLGLVFKDGKC